MPCAVGLWSFTCGGLKIDFALFMTGNTVEPGFSFRRGELLCDSVSIAALLKRIRTPFFIYSFAEIQRRIDALRQELNPYLISFAVKSNPTPSILRFIKENGCGFDVGSQGEFRTACLGGGAPSSMVFTGLGKTTDCLKDIIMRGIGFISVDDVGELARIEKIAGALRKFVGVLLRVNPDIDAETHRYITTGLYETKFGMDEAIFRKSLSCLRSSKRLEFKGVHAHIGSQICSATPFRRLADFILALRKKVPFEFVDIGGGFPIRYGRSRVLPLRDIVRALRPLFDSGLKVIIEPGRYIIGNAGALVTRVILNKSIGKKRYVVCDCGMNLIIRPPLYGASHTVVAVYSAGFSGVPFDLSYSNGTRCDVVGPICENTDYIAKDIKLPAVKEGEALAVMSAGAYCYSMSSNYNGYPKPAQYAVIDRSVKMITKPQGFDSLVSHEKII